MQIAPPPPQVAPAAATPAAEITADPAQPPTPGRVRLRCRVTADGSLGRCVVLDEQPPGAGLGDAALRVSAHMHYAHQPPAGGAVEFSMVFKVAPAPGGDTQTRRAAPDLSGAAPHCR